MAYTNIQPPFDLNFRVASKRVLVDYFHWFMDQTRVRPAILEHAVKETPGFTSWKADLSKESLSKLGEWFALVAETRQRSQSELDEIKENMTFPMEISENDLTIKTFSISVDIGIYFALTMIKNNPSLNWTHDLSRRDNHSYGRAVVSGFKANMTLDPVGIAVTLAYGLADKSRTGTRLARIYEVWEKDVE